jgi:hypothetical protein
MTDIALFSWHNWRRWRIWMFLTLAFALVLSQLPLFATVGFEHALASSIWLVIAATDLASSNPRRWARLTSPGPATFWRVLRQSTVAVLALASVPLLVGAISGIWHPVCDWQFAAMTGFAMPIFGGLLAVGVAHSLAIVCDAHQRWLTRLMPWLAVIALALHGLWRFYAAPPVFSYSPIVGYFPGNLYDERIDLSAPFWWARLDATLAVLALLFAVAWRRKLSRLAIGGTASLTPNRRTYLAWSIVCAAAWLAVRWQAGALGYSISAQDIQTALGGEFTTSHFVIHFDKRSQTIAAQMDLIASDHEFRYHQVVEQFGIAPPGKIHSYYFSSTDQKARWMGARDVEMAKPWRREIYLEHRDFPHGSLRHEIAHIVAGAAGDPWFAVSAQNVAGLPIKVNPGLIEGMAVALDWPGSYDRQQTPHESVQIMQAMGVTPNVDDLLSLGFLSLSSSRSYSTAGSFLRYLMDTYGAQKVRAYYRNGGDMAAAFGVAPSQVVAGWKAMLTMIEVSADTVAANRERFRGGSVFARPCPHAIAQARRLAYIALGEQRIDEAIWLFRSICSDDPHEPGHQLELANVLSGGNDTQRGESNRLWTTIATNSELSPSLRFSALQSLIDQAMNSNDLATARRWMSAARALSLDDGAARQRDAFAAAVDTDSAFALALRSYFFATISNTELKVAWASAAIALEPANPLGYYLRGLRQMDDGHWQAACDDLQTAIKKGLPSLTFERNAARRLAIAAYRAGDPKAHQAATKWLEASRNTVDRLLAKDWLTRWLVEPVTSH